MPVGISPALVAGVGRTGGGDARGSPMVAGLAAPFCYGLASACTKQSPLAIDPTDNAQGSMWALQSWCCHLHCYCRSSKAPSSADWLAVSVLAVVCTGAAYLIFFKLIEDVGPMRALSVTFLIPVFGVLWGALFLGETVGGSQLFGGALVLCGTALSNGVIRLRRRTNTLI
ncbi:MAG: DMT family transporter [Glaciimonas sp.]|nr:DMT family transporter [Glaciimonas sp.]